MRHLSVTYSAKIASLVLALSLGPRVALAQTPVESPVESMFGQLKSLVGTWNGINSAGTPLTVSVRETSAGSALLHEVHVESAEGEDMVSMFHRDGRRLVLTHYCSAGNQPRMEAHNSPGGRAITFDFFDATNLADSNDGHMSRVVIPLLDANHHTESYDSRAQLRRHDVPFRPLGVILFQRS